jgi:hypothetical protein
MTIIILADDDLSGKAVPFSEGRLFFLGRQICVECGQTLSRIKELGPRQSIKRSCPDGQNPVTRSPLAVANVAEK